MSEFDHEDYKSFKLLLYRVSQLETLVSDLLKREYEK